MAGARPGAGPGQSMSDPDDARRNPLGCRVEQLANVEPVNVVLGASCMTSILQLGCDFMKHVPSTRFHRAKLQSHYIMYTTKPRKVWRLALAGDSSCRLD